MYELNHLAKKIDRKMKWNTNNVSWVFVFIFSSKGSIMNKWI